MPSLLPPAPSQRSPYATPRAGRPTDLLYAFPTLPFGFNSALHSGPPVLYSATRLTRISGSNILRHGEITLRSDKTLISRIQSALESRTVQSYPLLAALDIPFLRKWGAQVEAVRQDIWSQDAGDHAAVNALAHGEIVRLANSFLSYERFHRFGAAPTYTRSDEADLSIMAQRAGVLTWTNGGADTGFERLVATVGNSAITLVPGAGCVVTKPYAQSEELRDVIAEILVTMKKHRLQFLVVTSYSASVVFELIDSQLNMSPVIRPGGALSKVRSEGNLLTIMVGLGLIATQREVLAEEERKMLADWAASLPEDSSGTVYSQLGNGAVTLRGGGTLEPSSPNREQRPQSHAMTHNRAHPYSSPNRVHASAPERAHTRTHSVALPSHHTPKPSTRSRFPPDHGNPFDMSSPAATPSPRAHSRTVSEPVHVAGHSGPAQPDWLRTAFPIHPEPPFPSSTLEENPVAIPGRLRSPASGTGAMRIPPGMRSFPGSEVREPTPAESTPSPPLELHLVPREGMSPPPRREVYGRQHTGEAPAINTTPAMEGWTRVRDPAVQVTDWDILTFSSLSLNLSNLLALSEATSPMGQLMHLSLGCTLFSSSSDASEGGHLSLTLERFVRQGQRWRVFGATVTLPNMASDRLAVLVKLFSPQCPPPGMGANAAAWEEDDIADEAARFREAGLGGGRLVGLFRSEDAPRVYAMIVEDVSA